MAEIWKEIGRVGKHTYIDDGTGLPCVLDATPELVRYWHDSGKAMRAAGLSIPIPLEHQQDAKPLTSAERAAKNLLNNAGFVDDFQLRKVKDEETGAEVDAVFGLHNIPDPSIVKKLPHTIKWVSPYISSFVDGAGREWNGVITHSALTTRPRITKQQPFADAAAALSLARMYVAPPFDPAKMPKGKGFAISRAGLLVGKDAAMKPAYPKAFSLWAGAKLATEEFPKKEEKKPESPEKPDAKLVDKPKEGDKPAEGLEMRPNPMMQEVEQALVDPDGDIAVHEVICDLLETMGITMPDDCTAENFLESLYRATMDKMKADKAAPPPITPDPLANPDMNKPAATPPEPKVEQPPIYMSLEAVQKIADPTAKSIAMSLHALQNNAIEGAKEVRQARLKNLLPKLKKEVRDRLTERAKSAAFSLTADGKVHDEMDEAISLLESALDIDVPDLLTSPRAALAVMPHPKEPDGKMTEERRQAVVNEQLKSAGRAPAYAGNGK